MKKVYLGIIFLVVITINVTAQQYKEQTIKAIIAEVEPDSLMRTVKDLEQMGTRFCFNPQTNKKVAVYLKDRYEQLGFTNVVIDSFYMENYTYLPAQSVFTGWQYNVMAALPGKVHPDQILILGAHLDNISTQYADIDAFDSLLIDSLAPGADDNATGIALLLEVARLYKKFNIEPDKTLRFMAFDGEELDFIGSRRAARNSDSLHENIEFYLNVDMIGYNEQAINNWKIDITGYSNALDLYEYAQEICEKYSTLQPVEKFGMMHRLDSYAYYENNFKTVSFTEHDMNRNYHTLRDSISKIDPAYLAEVTKLSLAMLLLENEHLERLSSIGTIDSAKVFTAFLSPNPAIKECKLTVFLTFSDNLKMELYSIFGEKVYTFQEYVHSGESVFPINISNLKAGIYIGTVKTTSTSKSIKFVVN